MGNPSVRDALYQKYIQPLQRKKSPLIGIEIEMPVATLDGTPTRHEVAQRAFCAAAEYFGFEKKLFDVKGVCYNAIRPDNADDLSFDCSYNNLEISFGCVSDIREAQQRFETYVDFINQELLKDNHLLTGMGINPNYQINKATYVDTGRYGMLGAYLHKCYSWAEKGTFHDYPAFGTFASASQVQLDVEEGEIADVLKAFALLEPVKAVLFANSVMVEEPELLCVRDMLWESSTHGINPHNVGFYDKIPQTVDELVDYILGASMFCTERDGHYLFFKPIPANQYFELEQVDGWYSEDDQIHEYRFKPEPGDLAYLRTYKHTDPTYRGTVEFRSCCCQPLSEAMTVAAFHVGLISQVPQLLELLESDQALLSKGSPAELRAAMNRRVWPEFVDEEGLRQLCLQVLELCRTGLSARGMGEEAFIEPLFQRAETLISPARKYVESREAGIPVAELVKAYSL